MAHKLKLNLLCSKQHSLPPYFPPHNTLQRTAYSLLRINNLVAQNQEYIY